MKFHNFFEMQKFVNNTLVQGKNIDKLTYNNITKYSDLKVVNMVGKIPFSKLDLSFLTDLEENMCYYFEYNKGFKVFKTNKYVKNKDTNHTTENWHEDSILIAVLDVDFAVMESVNNHYYNSERETYDWKAIFQIEVIYLLKFIQFLQKIDVDANICFSVFDKKPIVRIKEI